jgi:ribonuclease P protein component
VLPAAARLRRRQDFRLVIRGGRRVGRGALVVHLAEASAPNRGLPDPELGAAAARRGVSNSPLPASITDPARRARAGFVVSRAVGPAVTRNLVVRRLRHLLRDRLARVPLGTDLVVRALPTAAVRSYAELARDLDSALDKLLSRPVGPKRSRPGLSGDSFPVTR